MLQVHWHQAGGPRRWHDKVVPQGPAALAGVSASDGPRFSAEAGQSQIPSLGIPTSTNSCSWQVFGTAKCCLGKAIAVLEDQTLHVEVRRLERAKAASFTDALVDDDPNADRVLLEQARSTAA